MIEQSSASDVTQRSFSFKQRDKIAYPNLDSGKTPLPHDKSMEPSVSPKNGLDAIDSSAVEDDCDKFTSVNSTDSEYNFTENPILFSYKHLNDLIRTLCLL